jgi:dihydroorotate dehydrogenase
LRKILTELQIQNNQFKNQKPIFLKIAPDLSIEQIDDVISLAMEIKLDGLVAANTTIDRKLLATSDSLLETIGAGGLSGRPLSQKSTDIVQYIHQKTNGQLPIIASGGIFTGTDAQEKIAAGARLVQVWTGFVYEGPSIVKKIFRHLNEN